ncbi:MAG: hypothetical protein IT445_06385 [Phycisphaeraceae bacterium]|nr:hypothetical protein [Phycisphaeraceae bacterium]
MTKHCAAIPAGGFALLMALLLLAIAGSMLAMIARTSSRQMLDTIDAADGLQRKWAFRSCERLLLPQARDIIAEQQTEAVEAGTDIHVAEQTLVLGQTTIHLIFANEDAKLDVNESLQRAGQDATETSLRRMFRSGPKVDIALQPLEQEESKASKQEEKTWPAVATYEQIFVHAPPEDLCQSLSRNVTCWGSGQLDWHSAPPPVLESALAPDLSMGQLARLQQIRSEQPETNVGSLLSQLELSHQQRKRVGGRLTDDPQNYSLWTQLYTKERSWYSFAVVNMEHDKPKLQARLRW